ncbi:MAG: GWxTD domain-containing protein [Gemmatimonadetes bacterium]|nr:GWxTD domain-containing protein [Gemmatimonadota bacterium]
MFRFYRRLVCVVCLLCTGSAFAQVQETTSADVDSTAAGDPFLLPANSTGEIDFAVDVSGFRGAEEQTYLEFYFLCRPSEFTLEEKEDRLYVATFSIDLSIIDDQENIVFQTVQKREYQTDRPVVVTRRGEERVVLEQIAAGVNPGSYRAKVLVTDLNSNRQGEAIKPFIARPLDSPELSVSNLQLSTLIQRAEEDNRFTKNGLLVLPNPLRIFEKWAEMPEDGSYKPRNMFLYFEIYNLAPDSTGKEAGYDIYPAVTSHANEMSFPLPPKTNRRITGTDGLDVIALDYMTFPEGVYTLEVTVEDAQTGTEASSSAVFEIVQPPPPPPPVTALTEEQAKRGRRMLAILASKRERDLYDSLDLEGKTEFLIAFWRMRDPTPETPENESMMVFNERFSYADFQLGGAESDRGTVFIRYGQPEEIVRYDSDNIMKAHQIWYYTEGVDGDPSRTTEGGRHFFVFGDRRGIGRYELLHASARGELYNPQWRQELLLLNERFIQDNRDFGQPTLPVPNSGAEADPANP